MILGVLRNAGGGTAPLEPVPDLAAIETLIERARSSGLEVSFQVEGEQPQRVPEPVQIAAFRILQESLTNVRRHAPGAAARVDLAYGADRLRLAIENGTTHPGNGDAGTPGAGIAGMCERATALAGTLQTRRSGDRFRVVAELPYRRGA